MNSEHKQEIDLTEEAIASNRDALIGIVAWLFTTLGLSEGGSLPRMPRPVHRTILRVLVPAEAALRRLIVFAAQGLSVTVKPASTARSNPPPPKRGSSTGEGRGSSPLFQLIDPQKRSRPLRRRPKRAEPRILFFDYDPRICALPEWQPKPKPKPEPDGLIDPKRLCRRLEALKLALQDIPRQAKRLARWRARQEQKQASTPTAMPTAKPLSPLRDGPPPGYRKKRQHEVDDILAECHDLACLALAPDTS